MSFNAQCLRCFAAVSVIAAAMTARPSPALAQVRESALPDVLSGTRFPLSLRFRDLDAAWRRVTVGGQTPGARPAPGVGEADVYYTRGEIVAVGAETYLVAYRQDPASRARPAVGAAPPRRTLDTLLILSLLNLRASGSLLDIRPVNVQREVATRAAGPARKLPVRGSSRTGPAGDGRRPGAAGAPAARGRRRPSPAGP